MYYVYVLESKKYKKSYVGQTSNIRKRIEEHNNGQHAYTKRFVPWAVFAIEEFRTRKETLKREKYLKSASGRRYLKELFENKR